MVAELWWILGLMAIGFFVFAAVASKKSKPKVDPTKPKLIIVTAGTLGCLVLISVIAGILSSICSMALSIKRFME